MTSRIAITALLAIGAMMGSASAALGFSALSTDTNAAAAQYGQAPNGDVRPSLGGPGAAPRGGVAGITADAPTPAAPRGGVAGIKADSPTPAGVAGVTADSPTAAAQAPRQLDSGQLPFTGFAAIPLLLVGLALLTCGLVLRRRTGRAPSSLGAA